MPPTPPHRWTDVLLSGSGAHFATLYFIILKRFFVVVALHLSLFVGVFFLFFLVEHPSQETCWIELNSQDSSSVQFQSLFGTDNTCFNYGSRNFAEELYKVSLVEETCSECGKFRQVSGLSIPITIIVARAVWRKTHAWSFVCKHCPSFYASTQRWRIPKQAKKEMADEIVQNLETRGIDGKLPDRWRWPIKRDSRFFTGRLVLADTAQIAHLENLKSRIQVSAGTRSQVCKVWTIALESVVSLFVSSKFESEPGGVLHNEELLLP